AVRDDRDREPRVVADGRRDRHLFTRGRVEIPHKIRMPDEVVDAIADIPCRIEAEQRRRGRIAPEDLVLGFQNDAAVAKRARALPDLAQQAVILLLAVARLGANLLDARKELRPEPARLEARRALLAEQHAIEHVNLAQHVRDVERERRREPPGDGAEPQAEQHGAAEPRGEQAKLRCPALRKFHARSGEKPYPAPRMVRMSLSYP